MRSNHSSLNTPDRLAIFDLMAQALALPQPAAEPFEQRDASPGEVTAKGSASRRGLLERFDNRFWIRPQREIESSPAKTTDVYELEARIRAFEREVPHPYY